MTEGGELKDPRALTIGPALRYYSHSGRYEPVGLLLGLGSATMLAIAAGALYQLLQVVPLVIWKAFVICFLGGAVGYLSARILMAFKVRNGRLVQVVAVLGAVLSVYSAWCVMICRELIRAGEDGKFLLIFLSPDLVWEVMVSSQPLVKLWIGRVPHKLVPGDGVGGWRIWVIWGSEPLLAACCAFLGTRPALRRVFCEGCKSWCEKADAATVPAGAFDELRSGFESKDFNFINRLKESHQPGGSWQFSFFECRRCGKTNAVSVTAVLPVPDSAKVREVKKCLFENVLLAPDEYGRLLDAIEGPDGEVSPSCRADGFPHQPS